MAQPTMVLPKLIGERIKRREDPRLITGYGTFVDDVRLPGMLTAAILRSPYAHAKLTKLDLEAARRMPGVMAVLGGEDLRGKIGPIPCIAPAQNVPFRPVLALERVRFLGEPVAIVVAENSYQAQDAVDSIEADFEPLEVVVDPEKALEPGAPILHEAFGTNLCTRVEVPSPVIKEAFRHADRVIKFRIVNQRLAPVPMEPRGSVAQWNPGTRQLTLWCSTQAPHVARSFMAEMLSLPENSLRVIAPDVGGGFGCKFSIYSEEALVAYLAMQLNRPVKWTERRRENLQATTHGRDHITYLEVPVKNDGTILGMKASFIVDMGAYLQLVTPMIPTFGGMLMTGCYQIPAISFEQRLVFTNKGSNDAYRGAGRPEAAYLAERTMDMVAGELGLDPVELRRKHFIPREAFPYTIASGLQYDSGNYSGALDKALAILDYDKMRAEQAAARQQGRYVGIGFSTYVEICGLGPSAHLPPKWKGGAWESATVRVEPDGKVTVLTGLSPHGQGQETTFAQLAADALGVAAEDVMVVHGDTAMVQYGMGTYGSRGASIGGTALQLALDKVQAKLKTIASGLMEVPPDQLVFTQRTIALAADLSQSIPLQAAIDAAYLFRQPVPGIEAGLIETAYFEPQGSTFPFGTHVAMVEVDPATGKVSFLRYIAVDDCGNIINPMLVDGQVHGGIAQGIGQALYEEVVYDENGQLISGTLMDYAVPKAHMLPHYELDYTVTPTHLNPLGVKGIGEAGTIGSTPCVVNAVLDALRPLGIKNLDMPLKPERVWQAIQAAGKKG